MKIRKIAKAIGYVLGFVVGCSMNTWLGLYVLKHLGLLPI